MDDAEDVGTGRLTAVLYTIAFVLGFVLVAIGLWALAGAVLAAWGLFNDPGGIAYFAEYFLNKTDLARLVPGGGQGLAHYVAWIAVILMLLVLGKLGSWSVGAGAQLIAAMRTRRPVGR